MIENRGINVSRPRARRELILSVDETRILHYLPRPHRDLHVERVPDDGRSTCTPGPRTHETENDAGE